jgi:hypothetical protein
MAASERQLAVVALPIPRDAAAMLRYNALMQIKSREKGMELPANVRHSPDSGWQVQLGPPFEWHTCRSEQDACFIASGMRIADAVNKGTLGGREVAEELDAAAAVAIRAVGQVGAQTLIDAAVVARAEPTSRPLAE